MLSSPVAFFDSPASELFRFWPLPENEPLPIPPPHFDYPFTIPDNWYQAALDYRVPITIATIYAVSAKALNKYNTSTGKKPWGISKIRHGPPCRRLLSDSSSRYVGWVLTLRIYITSTRQWHRHGAVKSRQR